jgi:hypothetical protein
VLASILAARATGADAPPCRYVLGGDGTVIDTKTKLTWQQALATPVGDLDWPTAMQYCATLRLAGGSRWRLPTIKELLTLVDVSVDTTVTTPVFAIDARVLPTPASSLWSSTLASGTPTPSAWVLTAGGAATPADTSTFGFGVRCVR